MPKVKRESKNSQLKILDPKERGFKCDFPGCTKAFFRKDHLKRHSLNHDDKAKLHVCEECGMKFKRIDVKKDHVSRHLRAKAKEIQAINFIRESTIFQNMKNSNVRMANNNPLPSSEAHSQSLNEMEAQLQQHKSMNSGNEASLNHPSKIQNEISPPVTTSSNGTPSINSSEIIPGSINDWTIGINDSIFLPSNTSPGGTYRLAPFDSGLYELTDHLVRPDLNFEYSLNSALSDLLQSDLGNIPRIETNHNEINENHLKEFMLLIPPLVNYKDFEPKVLETCMEIYWNLFHVQYPILHRPSFNSLTTPPILLLAMVMMGACFSKAVGDLLEDPIGLANEIAIPLRWLIFRHRTSGASKPWELQSLLILEVFEKNYSSRLLHERSSVHQAAKIEMMKRSTVLGGDPYATVSKSSTELKENSEYDLWNKWVYAESMKRCALMSFCFDLNSTINSGHQSTLFVNKLRLGLPCDDLLWEANLEELKNIKVPKNPELVLTSLKRLLKNEKVVTSSFGKKVMLHVLLSLMVQFELKDETVAMVSDNSTTDMLKDVWRDKLSYALDAWKYNVNEGSCCDLNSLLIDLRARMGDPGTSYFDLNDTKCKFPTYHMAQIRLRIVPHDMLILSGIPIMMSVKMDDVDYNNVENRLKKWSNSLDGRVSVVHAYLCLIECLANDDSIGYIDYRPEKDPIHERAHIIISCTLIVWCYCFIEIGPESDNFNLEKTHFKEDGYNYLQRVKSEFDPVIITDGTVADYHMSIKRCALKLPKIERLNNIAGLCSVVSDLYSHCFWQLGREYSRLLVHCKDRMMGKKEPFCSNVYDFKNEF